ncbi:MAG TPA: ABC transporter substrate-binding protein [Gaiellaceae bacterium]|nr:ABC transporter substrate-binding protein [Gaiellaceae bacterium]
MPVVRRSRPFACALLLAALAGAGCGERDEPVGTLAQPYPVTVQGVGGNPTALQSPPERIVALDPGSAELLGALGAGEEVVGIPAGTKRPEGSKARRIVSRTGNIDVDGTVELDPDLVVATQTADQLDVARIERLADAAVYVQPAASLRNVEQAAVDLGFLVGEAARARQLVGRIQHDVAAIQERLAGVQPVSVFVDTGFFITVSDRSLLGDLVKRAKGASVAGPSPGPGPYPLAQLRRADPEFLLVTSDSDTTLQSLRANPMTARLEAVRRKRFVVVPAALVNRAGPRVADGLEAIARALHPDAFR